MKSDAGADSLPECSNEDGSVESAAEGSSDEEEASPSGSENGRYRSCKRVLQESLELCLSSKQKFSIATLHPLFIGVQHCWHPHQLRSLRMNPRHASSCIAAEAGFPGNFDARAQGRDSQAEAASREDDACDLQPAIQGTAKRKERQGVVGSLGSLKKQLKEAEAAKRSRLDPDSTTLGAAAEGRDSVCST